jgi:selenide,water dikinase
MGAILRGGASVAQAAGAPVAGGHSIDAAEPIYGLVALGVVNPRRVLTNASAKPGDVLILGKPLGIGVFSAALKRGLLSDADYGVMVASTTRLNTPGAELATISGVHALTDVTGFGLLGHLREVVRASGVRAVLHREAIPVFPGALRHAEAGIATGASARNWAAVRPDVEDADQVSPLDQTLLSDPQTSGGLLVSCSMDAAGAVLDVFRRQAHAEAAVIGRIEAGPGAIRFGS